ncbi:serine hydrolase domain-containing protein [Actinacidiphila sp. DG2A-62]|uniref:serine hydrolase domain-containing protein n=1 Tax=Actinacidiphila sp. DG2A-62 TaxID=3108821 RepID=UPI002DB7BA70|nr:serine hydrolase domain-containing protein [Actinacidiphila sp. DG2A-62]MEC3998243.1 serine hydrolase domain-containing protein [Actinacidiphila sp. DG2A-62]
MPVARRARRVRRPRLAAALLAAAASFGCLLSGPAHAGTPGHAESPGRSGPHASAGEDRALRARLAAFTAAPGGPPGAVAVIRVDGRRAVYRAGVADLATGRPPRARDHMRIASTAKAFSGAVALSLVDAGRLRLDDTIGRRLPRLPKAWGKVTLRQLLQHTSGLPDYSEAPSFVAELTADPHHHFDSRRLLDYVAGLPLGFAPGSRYHYSNSDNIAVALMAEAATGRRYESLLDTLVDRPLRLRDTTLPQDWRLPEPYLHGYAPGEDGGAPEDVSTLLSASGVWASGGIVSTPDDLAAFTAGYAGGQLFGPAVRRAQFAFVPGASEPAGPGVNAAGLAVFRYATRCGTVYGHTGNFPGYTQFAAATADGRRAVTVSITRQVNATVDPQRLPELRALEEDFVCAALHGAR